MHSCLRVQGTSKSRVSLAGFLERGPGDWKVAITRGQECRRYGAAPGTPAAVIVGRCPNGAKIVQEVLLEDFGNGARPLLTELEIIFVSFLSIGRAYVAGMALLPVVFSNVHPAQVRFYRTNALGWMIHPLQGCFPAFGFGRKA
jgi:hypothetical protein